MRLFGIQITKAVPESLRPITESRGWWPYIRESFAGAWQQNVQVNQTTVVSYSAVFACISLIASDIAKLGIKLVKQDDKTGIWTETSSPSFSNILKHPNHYQNHIQFVMQWILSKLIFGNTYVLKVRDNRNVISQLYILDPTRVKPLVAPNGDVYYQLMKDLLSGLEENTVTVPASEVIHDIMIPLYHPLVGVSPIYACGLAATQGTNIQNNSAKFFGNNSAPGGILTAPGIIDQVTADRLKADWEANYGGANFGKTAVLGDGLKYEAMMVNAVDSQLIDQLKWTAETVCSCFHVPPYMIGVGSPPVDANVESRNQQYYSQCLQILIESLEICLDDGIELPSHYGTECDISNLLRMDTASHINAVTVAIKGGLFSPNEGRKEFDKPPVPGGDTPYLQQQQWSLEALNRRDNAPPPTPTNLPPGPALPAPANNQQPALPAPKKEADEFLASEQLKFITKFRELEDDAV